MCVSTLTETWNTIFGRHVFVWAIRVHYVCLNIKRMISRATRTNNCGWHGFVQFLKWQPCLSSRHFLFEWNSSHIDTELPTTASKMSHLHNFDISRLSLWFVRHTMLAQFVLVVWWVIMAFIKFSLWFLLFVFNRNRNETNACWVMLYDLGHGKSLKIFIGLWFVTQCSSWNQSRLLDIDIDLWLRRPSQDPKQVSWSKKKCWSSLHDIEHLSGKEFRLWSCVSLFNAVRMVEFA